MFVIVFIIQIFKYGRTIIAYYICIWWAKITSVEFRSIDRQRDRER